jgi:hypothetical protein
MTNVQGENTTPAVKRKKKGEQLLFEAEAMLLALPSPSQAQLALRGEITDYLNVILGR